MKDITFKVGNDQLKGTMFYPRILKNKNPGALIIHGWTSSRDRYIEQSELLNKLGIICLTVDLRGHGESDGNIKTQTRQEFLDDVLAAYDFLAKNSRVDENNITVIGSSFGAYLGSLLTSYRETKNLVLRVPANYPNGDFNESQFKHSSEVEILKWRFEVKNPQETLALMALHAFDGNILIVESGQDEIIPHQTIQNYLSALKDKSKLKYIVMEGAPHSITNHPEFKKAYNKLVYDWLKDKIND